jgi:hypothetical protein
MKDRDRGYCSVISERRRFLFMLLFGCILVVAGLAYLFLQNAPGKTPSLEKVSVIIGGGYDSKLNRDVLTIWKNVNRSLVKVLDETPGGMVTGIAVGDVDGDNEKELLVSVAVRNASTSFDQGYLYLYESVQGRFVRGNESIALLSEERISALAIGDADNDGMTDNFVLCSGHYPVRVYKYAEGAYHVIYQDTDWIIGHPPEVARIGDADNDGKNEILVGKPGTITVYDYESGTFTNTRYIPAPSSVLNVWIADVDGDGRNEVVFSGNFRSICARANEQALSCPS